MILKNYFFKRQIPDPESTSGFRIEEEQVNPERWGWGVVYDDDSELRQFGDDGRFHQVGEIEQDRIKLAVLYKLDDSNVRIDIPWEKGMKMIHKYKRFVFEAGTENERKETVYVFGWHKGGVNSYSFILPDDRIVFSPNEEPKLTDFNI